MAGWASLIPIGASLLGSWMGAKKQKAADKRQALLEQIAMREWNAGAPLRERARAMAMAPIPERENLDAMFADPGNPYARRMARPAPAAVAPMAADPMAAATPSTLDRVFGHGSMGDPRSRRRARL